jgi:ABC-type dipeptide/oligopeptide/nickel transport system permease subunit
VDSTREVIRFGMVLTGAAIVFGSLFGAAAGYVHDLLHYVSSDGAE